jgi:hypothetical protein
LRNESAKARSGPAPDEAASALAAEVTVSAMAKALGTIGVELRDQVVEHTDRRRAGKD